MKKNTDIKKCPYCNYKFESNKENTEYVDQVPYYYCPNCGEEIIDGLEIKSNYTKYYSKREWN